MPNTRNSCAGLDLADSTQGSSSAEGLTSHDAIGHFNVGIVGSPGISTDRCMRTAKKVDRASAAGRRSCGITS